MTQEGVGDSMRRDEKLLEAISRLLEAKLDHRLAALESRMGSFDTKMTEVDNHVKRMNENFDRLQRTVNAIESFPVPYGRPKTFHGATEYHSVSGAVRKNAGY